MLMLALAVKGTGESASRRLKIKDELLALDFDTAVAYRLLAFENEQSRDKFKALSIMLGGDSDESGDNAPEIEGGALAW